MKTMLLVMAATGSLVMAGAANAADAGADLAKAKGCLGCHAVAEKKVGPAYKDIAAKYKGNKDAEAMLIAKLKEGKGHMKVAASDAELKTLVQWSLSAK
jgi:cytochrome c